MKQFDESRQYGREGLARFEDVNHRWGVAASWCRIGMAELGLGVINDAARSFRSGLDKSVENGMQLLTGYALMGVGRTLAAADRGPEAAALLIHNVGLEPNPYVALAQEPLDELREKLSAAELQHAESQAADLSVEAAVAMARSAVADLIEHSG